MLQNAYFLAKIGSDTAENEQNFAEICQKLVTTLRVRRLGLLTKRRVRAHLGDHLRDDLTGPSVAVADEHQVLGRGAGVLVDLSTRTRIHRKSQSCRGTINFLH